MGWYKLSHVLAKVVWKSWVSKFLGRRIRLRRNPCNAEEMVRNGPGKSKCHRRFWVPLSRNTELNPLRQRKVKTHICPWILRSGRRRAAGTEGIAESPRNKEEARGKHYKEKERKAKKENCSWSRS